VIITSLCAYYNSKAAAGEPDMPGPGYMPHRITHVVEITAQGRLERVTPFNGTGPKPPPEKRTMIPWTLEAACRKSNLAAHVLVDKPKYSLGMDGCTPTPDHARRFRHIVDRLTLETGDQGVLALQRFLRQWDPKSALGWPDWDEIDAGVVAFRLQGDPCLIHERPDFRIYWDEAWLNWSDSESAVRARCLMTGRQQNIARVHQPLKEVSGAQTTGAALVSFNKDAFTSYGKEQSYNAPIGQEAAFAYTTALNHLLRKDNGRSIRIGDATTVYWANSPEAERIVRALIGRSAGIGMDGVGNTGQSEDMHKLLMALRAGGNPALDDPALSAVRFHLLGLSPNRARLTLRFWHMGTIGELLAAFGRHYAQIALDRQFDSQPALPSVRQLLAATASIQSCNGTHAMDFGSIPPLLSGALIRSVLTGSHYPMSFFSVVLSRIRMDKQVTYLRAAALKGCLLRNHPEIAGEMPMSLDETRTDPPYLLGRLFAILEKTQREALGTDIRSTIRDSCFGAACATPPLVFPRLLRQVQHHIKRSAYGLASDRKIKDVMQHIREFPAHLSLPEQGVFCIGYYHQGNAHGKSVKEDSDAGR
jgi:CRISPR-associated protein Csd1